MDLTSYVVVNEDQLPLGRVLRPGGSPYSVDWPGAIHHWASEDEAQKYCDILNGHVDLQQYSNGRGYYVKHCDTHIANINKHLTEPEGNPDMKSMWKAAECEKCHTGLPVMLTPSQEAEIREFIVRNRQSMYPYVMTDAMSDMMDTIDALWEKQDETSMEQMRRDMDHLQTLGDIVEWKTRAEVAEPDARRWRAVRGELDMRSALQERDTPEQFMAWWLIGVPRLHDGNEPETLDEVADRLAAEQEARNG